jgi:hypothetical protein
MASQFLPGMTWFYKAVSRSDAICHHLLFGNKHVLIKIRIAAKTRLFPVYRLIGAKEPGSAYNGDASP